MHQCVQGEWSEAEGESFDLAGSMAHYVPVRPGGGQAAFSPEVSGTCQSFPEILMSMSVR